MIDSTNSIRERISSRRKTLHNAGKMLKQQFIGIDDVIDKIIYNMETWYCMPEVLTRPVIVNLWGMTGVGKTDLVRKLVKHIEFGGRYLEVPLDKTDTWDAIEEKLEYSGVVESEPGILLLDEVQRFRTVTEDDQDIQKSEKHYQDIWTLLSDGRFGNDDNKHGELVEMYLTEQYNFDRRRSSCVTKGIKFKLLPSDTNPFELTAEQVTELERKIEIIEDKMDEDDTSEINLEKLIKEATGALSNDDDKNSNSLYKQSVWSATRFKNKLRLKEPLEEIMKWDADKKMALIEQKLDDPDFNEGADYSKLIIFVCGNLDEAYRMANMVDNVDVEADVLHSFSKKITVTDIKKALRKRFKPEQIARLGNIHVLYPSLSKANYIDVIKKTIHELQDQVIQQCGVHITVDQTIINAIYENGVYPTQGVRPVFSTVSLMLNNTIPSLLMKALTANQTQLDLWFADKHICTNINEELHRVYVECSIDNIKDQIDDNHKIVNSVHESGHAVIYALLFGCAPLEIHAVAANEGGFMGGHKIFESRTNTIKNIMVGLAGVAAEHIVFGDRLVTNGCSKDIETVTEEVAFYVRESGFDQNFALTLIETHDRAQSGCNDTSDSNDRIRELVGLWFEQTKQKLSQHKVLLAQVSRDLFDMEDMSPISFIESAKKVGYNFELRENEYNHISGYKQLFEKFDNEVNQGPKI